MKRNDSNRPTIGIMLGDVESDYTMELMRGFYSCAREEDVNVVFMAGPQIPQYCADILAYNLEGNYNYQFDTIYDYVHFMNLDALIVATGSISYYYHNYNREAFLEKFAKVPYIIIQDIDEEKKIPYLLPDNYNAMRSCVEHLVKDHGYKKIAFLCGPKVNREAVERLAGYRDVMEENGITVEDKMIAYGNYTELVEDLAAKLLDENIGLEAIVCANDNMAKGCYRVCKQRNLVIGKDIAITGFDDVDLAKRVDPPLTSVSQRSFKFSYTAVQKAIALCKGEKVSSGKLSTILVKRRSCGCCGNSAFHYTQAEAENLEQYIHKASLEVASVILAGLPYKNEKLRFAALVEDYFQYIRKNILEDGGKEFEMAYLLEILQEFVTYPHISDRGLSIHFTELLQTLASNTKDSSKSEQLVYIINATEQFISNSINQKLEKDKIALNRKAWFVPNFTRDLNRKGARDDLREVMCPIMERFKMMKVKSCYIYLFDEPVIYDEEVSFEIPKKIYLTAYYNEKEMVCYASNERPCVTAENGFTAFVHSKEPEVLTSFILFSGEKQYGILLCEVEREDISFLQICGMQLGSLLRYLDLNWAEQESYKSLQKSLKVIREQNSILSFISEYDELSNLLNRRGFMERVLMACKKNDGRKAYLIFGDLDRLKEINDKFGHNAGDFAIKTAADRFKNVLPKDAIVARIGGDEFIAVVISGLPGFANAFKQQMKEEGELFNANEEIPYYVEVSVGICEFYCEPQVDITALMQKSDELLYEAKKNRRASIEK
ncbi:MAG: GGDEF domain-containing protein [Lachnospiraceae bacterium]|nr:GGDEF domain-containing protein [Lachnospiraceae bacterium]